ncbi:MAG: hypothetical protein IJS01_08510 [Lentisphaeria bacterium]|nr:hypothetical protein [Lentisphaeria bacterium]
MPENDLYLHASYGEKLLYCDSTEAVENAAVTASSGERIPLTLLKREMLEDGRIRCTFDAANLAFWSPDAPVLYAFSAEGFSPETFGLCEIGTIGGKAVTVNGKPFLFRGCIRGITAHDHPNLSGESDYASFRKYISQAKKYGFNLVRFHSTVPSEDFVRAADELGFFIHMEIGFAYEYDEQGNKKNLALDNADWRKTILRFRNRPSVAIFCIGNEMHNAGHQILVEKLYREGKSLAPAKLVLDNSGWGEFDRASADIFSQHIAYYFPYKRHRDMFLSDDCWHLNGSAKDTPMTEENGPVKIRRHANPAKPVLAHEALHYIEIPDYEALNAKFDAFSKRVGPEYLAKHGIAKPRYMEGFSELVKTKGIAAKLPDYRAASEHFKKFALKTYLERLRLSGLCGFEMLQFSDCFKYENKNGIVDCFDDDKYIDPAWMRQFNDDAVLLTDLPEECFAGDEKIRVPLFLSNFTRAENVFGTLTVTVETPSGSAELYRRDNIFAVSGVQKLIDIEFALPAPDAPEEDILRAEFSAPGIVCRNGWKIWRYPARNTLQAKFDLRLEDRTFADWIRRNTAPGAASCGVVLRDRLGEELFSDLEAGKTVILFYHRDNPGQEPFYWPGALERFKPCIWDRGSNLGGIIREETLRRALGCGKFFDAPLYDLIEGAYKLDLDHFPGKMTELISGVDKPVRDRMKGLIHGVRDFIPDDTLRNFCHCGVIDAGKGKLVVCTFNTASCGKPAAAGFFAALLDNAADFRAESAVGVAALKDYLSHAPVVREDVMNHFWELDDKPVEDTLFWEETGIDLSKLK